MRRTSARFALGVFTVLAVGGAARADPYDIALTQLGNPTAGGVGYSAKANGNFQAFARELGVAIAGSELEPANSMGLSGFTVDAELATASFATRSSTFRMPTTEAFGGTFLMPGIHVRKGLPFSLEIGAKAAWLGQSGMATGTVEARWTITEGGGYLPAVAVRGAFTKLFNTPDFALQTGDLDLSVGKKFVLGGMVSLSPFLGYALGWTYAQSNTLGFDPTLTAADSERAPSASFAGTGKYKTVSAGSNTNNRVFLGGRFQGGVFELAAEVALCSAGSFGEPQPDGTVSTTDIRNLPAVFAFNLSAGLAF